MAKRPEDLRRELIKTSGGDFFVVHQALKDTARAAGSRKLDMDDVKTRIRTLVSEKRAKAAAS